MKAPASATLAGTIHASFSRLGDIVRSSEQDTPMNDPVSRIARSWRLIKASTAVLNDDGELLLLPILAGAASLAVGGAMLWQAFDFGTFAGFSEGEATNPPASFYAWLFVFYLVQYFIIIFFNTALVGAAIERLDGGDPTIRSALGLAFRRIMPIFGYALVSATIGVLLRLLGERLGIIGRLIAAGAGLGWTVMTFLVVPVLAAEGIDPLEAIQRSAALLRKTWGENLIGSAGISVIMGALGGIVILAAFAIAHLISSWSIAVPLLLICGLAARQASWPSARRCKRSTPPPSTITP